MEVAHAPTNQNAPKDQRRRSRNRIQNGVLSLGRVHFVLSPSPLKASLKLGEAFGPSLELVETCCFQYSRVWTTASPVPLKHPQQWDKKQKGVKKGQSTEGHCLEHSSLVTGDGALARRRCG